MNDPDIDKMFDKLNAPVPPSLEDRILATSSKALKRTALCRKMLTGTTITFVILLICIGSFLAGQSHQQHKTITPIQANAGDQDMITITVHKDFLKWVEAGHFFTKIEMKDKASEAYNRAITFIPKQSFTMQNKKAPDKLLSRSKTNDEFKITNCLAMIDPVCN